MGAGGGGLKEEAERRGGKGRWKGGEGISEEIKLTRRVVYVAKTTQIYRYAPAPTLSTLPLILNLFLGVFILRLESIFMGVPANPFFVRFVGVGPAEAFSWLVPSSGLRRLAFGGVGRVCQEVWG